ncbi:MAG: dimethylsulfonioproprionate lyase family protein [Roseovarius sp.]
MPRRPQELDAFLTAFGTALSARVKDGGPEQVMVARSLAALERPGEPGSDTPERLPACQHLPAVCDPRAFAAPDLRAMAEAFLALEPALKWRKRGGDAPLANAAYAEGHANAMIAGPGGLERRADLWLGATLLAPHVRYPDHTHPPEETYLVMSPGQFGHGDEDWVEPGIGGTFHNTPGIVHRMASGPAPFLTFWVLWSGDTAT